MKYMQIELLIIPIYNFTQFRKSTFHPKKEGKWKEEKSICATPQNHLQNSNEMKTFRTRWKENNFPADDKETSASVERYREVEESTGQKPANEESSQRISLCLSLGEIALRRKSIFFSLSRERPDSPFCPLSALLPFRYLKFSLSLSLSLRLPLSSDSMSIGLTFYFPENKTFCSSVSNPFSFFLDRNYTWKLIAKWKNCD